MGESVPSISSLHPSLLEQVRQGMGGWNRSEEEVLTGVEMLQEGVGKLQEEMDPSWKIHNRSYLLISIDQWR